MRFKETGSAIDFEPCPAAMHIARCIRIVDLGTKFDAMYGKEKHEVFFMWEIPGELKTYTIKGQQGQPDKEVIEPFTIGRYYTMSLSEGANLRIMLESWRSRGFTATELDGFDPKVIVGVPCMINVIHKPHKKKAGVIVAAITAVTPLPKGVECLPAFHPLVYFSMDAGEYNPNVFENLTGGIKSRVMQSNEYQAITMGHPAQTQQENVAATAQPPAGHPAALEQTAAQPQQQAPPNDGFDDIPF
jgi:hypothetical protein